MPLPTCQSFLKAAGWHCSPVQTKNAQALYVCTPLNLSDGKPLDFYLIDRGEKIELTDDGLTLFALRLIGYPLDDKRNWRSLESLAQKFGFELTERGAFRATFQEGDLWLWSSCVLQLYSAIVSWDLERQQDDDADMSLVREIEHLLRLRDPARKLESDAIVSANGVDWHFSFRWGEMLVDAVAASANATNARLRKALMVSRLIGAENMLFIVDDRNDLKKAEQERAVIGQIAQATTLSNFAAPLHPLH